MASVETVIKKMDEGDKCSDCNQLVHARDKSVENQMSDRWFHTKCQGISKETYRLPKKKKPQEHTGTARDVIQELKKS